MVTVTGPTLADRIGDAISACWQARARLFREEADPGAFQRAEGRILGLAQALAILRHAPNPPTAADIKAIAEEFRPEPEPPPVKHHRPEEGWRFSREVIDKAKRYLRDGAVTRGAGVEGLYYVQGSALEPYLVTTDADADTRTAHWIACTCPHGANKGAGTATCSHAVAVLLVISDGRDVPETDRWKDPR